MIHDPSAQDEHQATSGLMPWYVNGTIGERDRQRVDAHLRGCAQCREELSVERRICQGMAAESSVEYIPAVSLKRLQARLDALGGEVAAQPTVEPSVRRQSSRPRLHWQRLAAASIAVIAVAGGLLLANQWLQVRTTGSPYYTVTISEPRPTDEVIRAVFSRSITLVELQAILDETELRIISGPTEAGVYSLAANSRRPVSSSLALLRQHAAVRFAESTQREFKPNAKPGEPP